MKSRFICALLLFGLDQGTATGSPLEKVVELLEGIAGRLSQDAKVETQIYNKYACWCEKTADRKAGAIEGAQDELRELGQNILKFKGKVAVLTSEIANLAEKIKANLAAQEEATSIREKEHGAFEASTAEAMQATAALEKAVDVLRKGSGVTDASFLQHRTTLAKDAVKAVISAVPQKASLTPEQMSLLGEFATTSTNARYAPQSATVQGILQDMYTTFTLDIEEETKAEALAQRSYEDYINEKSIELKADRKTKKEKEDEKAKSEAQLADTTQTYDNTEAQMNADKEFFEATQEACLAKHEEWTTRVELRDEEIKGIEEALKILTSDENRALFAKTIKAGKETNVDESQDSGRNVDHLHATNKALGRSHGIKIDRGAYDGVEMSFLQLHRSASGSPVLRAYNAVKTQATQSHSLRLAALAAQIHTAKAGHFDKVIASIDAMLTTLQEEGAADLKKRDQCVDEYKNIDSTLGNVRWLIEKNNAKIDKLQGLIDLREEQKAQTIAQMEEVNQSRKELKEQRISDNQDYLHAKKEDQQAIEVLKDARDALTSYYKNRSIEMGPLEGGVKDAFLQQGPDFEVSADQAPDADFSDKGSRKHETKGALQLLTSIMQDIEDEIKNDMTAEFNAQLQFEKQWKAATDLIGQLHDKSVDLEALIAKRTEERGDEEADRTSNKGDLKDELDYQAKITPDCDWIIKAFTGRAARRKAESEGLTSAKEFLVGENGGAALLESAKRFDDNRLANIGFMRMSA